MSAMAAELHYRKLRAPQGDGETLIDPPAEQVGEVLERNRSLIQGFDIELQGRPLSRLIANCRSQLIQAASSATRQYRDVDIPALSSPAPPIMLAGHQPELFHPGVWYKNFVLCNLAAEHRAVAINLVIDSDVAKDALVRVPTGRMGEPRVESVPFDHPSGEIPFEERSIVDRDCWTSFGQRVRQAVRSLVPYPLFEDIWPLAFERSVQTDQLGICLSQARHQLEGAWGAQTLELPQSQVCQLEAFHWFTAHLLAHLPRFWDIYNSSVTEYRRVNRVRSSAHPVPNLATDDRWLEAPFWIWSSDSPTRRRLFAFQPQRNLYTSTVDGRWRYRGRCA
jgi:hypothetical protein